MLNSPDDGSDSKSETSGTSPFMMRLYPERQEREKKVKNEEKNEQKEKQQDSDIYCVYCGKNVEDDEAAIKNHEKECLDKWKRRKTNALDIPIITDAFKDEFDGVSENFWQQHLTQLVPCSRCSRKFNPDRVRIHEKSCKGQ